MHTAPKSKLLIWLKNSRKILNAQKGSFEKKKFLEFYFYLLAASCNIKIQSNFTGTVNTANAT
jgi:hypothetical protein